jgi:YD repeat-containing protein
MKTTHHWLLILSFCAVNALAEVNPKDGAFFNESVDLNANGGAVLVDRIYNSRNTNYGIFGWGWESHFDTRLELGPSGIVVVHDWGGGAKIVFSSQDMLARDTDSQIASIMKAASSETGGPESRQGYRQRLQNDLLFRVSQWNRFHLNSKNTANRSLSEYTSTEFGKQSVVATPQGFLRTLPDGSQERFDENGKLTQIRDTHRNTLDLVYGAEGHLKAVKGPQAYELDFSFKELSKGLLPAVASIEDNRGNSLTYTYNQTGDLISNQASNQIVHLYEYDQRGRHLLTAIRYINGKVRKIAYYPIDQFEKVQSVTQPDGTLTQYRYEHTGTHPYDVKTLISEAQSDGSIEQTSFTFLHQNGPRNKPIQKAALLKVNGRETSFEYDSTGNLTSRSEEGMKVSFHYDNRGRLASKETPLETLHFHFDDNAGVVTQIDRQPKSAEASSSWVRFAYEQKKVVKATTSSGDVFKLIWDKNDRLEAFSDSLADVKVRIIYDHLSVPVKFVDMSGKPGSDQANQDRWAVSFSKAIALLSQSNPDYAH